MLLKIVRTTEWFVDIADDKELIEQIEKGKDADLESLVLNKDDEATHSSFKAKFVANRVVRRTVKPDTTIGFKNPHE